jgi:hypothetical protein
MACLPKRGTEESNLEQGFWRPPCYRYTSPPKAQSIRFAGLLCMFGMWRRPSSCVSRVRPAAASRDQGYPRQRSGTTPRPQAVAPRPERARCASRRRSSPVRAASPGRLDQAVVHDDAATPDHRSCRSSCRGGREGLQALASQRCGHKTSDRPRFARHPQRKELHGLPAVHARSVGDCGCGWPGRQ